MNEVNTAGERLSLILSQIVAGVPRFLGALLILVIGYFVAKGLCKLVKGLLGKADLDSRLHSGHGGNAIQRAMPSPTHFIGKVVFWLVFLFAISIAASALGIPAIVMLVSGIYSYIPNVLAAILIFMVAGTIAGGVATMVTNLMGDTPTGKAVATAAPTVVMAIASFMILNQLKIAPAIVTITYAALMFGSALAFALAFGLGGREVARYMLESVHSKARVNKDRVMADIEVGKARTQVKKEKIARQFARG